MDTFEKIFSQDKETLQMYEQFKDIKKIYENSLIAMGVRAPTDIISVNTDISLSGLEIGSTKGY